MRDLLTGIVSTCLLVGAATIAHAGWIEDSSDGTIIHVRVHDWIYPDPSHPDTGIQSEAAKVRLFTRTFPKIFEHRYKEKYQSNPEKYGTHDWDHVQVHVHNFSGIKVEGVESDLLAIAGKVAPDILYVNFRKSHTYIDGGFLYPLDRVEDDYLTSMSKQELDFRVHDKIWPVIRRKSPEGPPQVWALPFGGALGKVLMFRKDLFDEAGIPYPTEDWTWNDLYEACRKLTDPSRGIYGIRFVSGKHESYHWAQFLWGMGGDVLTHDAQSDQWRVTFNSPEGAEALDFYTRLCTEPWIDGKGRKQYGYAYKDPSDWHIKWERGEIAMKYDYVFEKLVSRINPDLEGMVPVPIGPTGIRGAELNSKMMGLFSEIEEPAVRDAAWEFVRFFDSREAVEAKTRVMVEGGLGRFVNPKYLRMFDYDELIRFFPKGWDRTFKIAVDTGRPEPYGRHSNIAYDIMTKPIEEAAQLALKGKLPQDTVQRKQVLQGLLNNAAERARREMLDELPPKEIKKQRITAGVFLILVVIIFYTLLSRIVSTFTPSERTAGNRQGSFRRYKWAYFILLPAVLTILLWQYVPLLKGTIMAFQDYRIMGHSTWTGLDNFGAVLWDNVWWQSVWNALRYCFLVVVLTFLPPVILAIFLQEIPRGTVLFRTIFYLPAVISGLVVILLWKSFYDRSELGVLNHILMQIPAGIFILAGLACLGVGILFYRRLAYHELRFAGLLSALAGFAAMSGCISICKPIFMAAGWNLFTALGMTLSEPYWWLSNPDLAMTACVIPLAWAHLGPGCLIYLAALKGIPDDLYEAAEIDGATFTDKILFVIFPIFKPLLIINFIGIFVGSWFYAEASILAMTGGAANTEVAGLHIFYKAFIFHQFGPATAMAWVLAVMLIGFTVYQLKILSRLEFKTTGEK